MTPLTQHAFRISLEVHDKGGGKRMGGVGVTEKYKPGFSVDLKTAILMVRFFFPTSLVVALPFLKTRQGVKFCRKYPFDVSATAASLH